MAKVLLFMIIIGIVCLAVDIGYVVAVRYEILNVEDAAALAGTMQSEPVADGWDQWGRPNHWYADIHEGRARLAAEETFWRNVNMKPILRAVTFKQIHFSKRSSSRYEVSVEAEVPLPITTTFLSSFGYPAPVPWTVKAESIGGFQ